MEQVFIAFFEMVSELHWLLQWCALWLIWGPINIVLFIVKTPFLIWNRGMRQLNIKNAGWPPSHLDASGNFKKEEKEQ